MDKPSLADLLGTKSYKTEQAAKNAVGNVLRNGSGVGKLGVDTRVVFRAATKTWWVEEIEKDLQEPSVEKEAESFGSRVEGGNANPPAKKKEERPKKRAVDRAAERAASAGERLARVRAEANGEAPARKQGTARPELPAMPEGSTGPYVLVIPEWPTAADPRHWALEFSKRLKLPVSIVPMPEAKMPWLTIDAKALRPERRGAPVRRGGTPEGFDLWAIEQALQPGGVMRSALKEKAGKGRNWFGYMKRIGERFGYSVTPDRSGPTPRYAMAPLPPAAA
jgi:hypothetical protein